MTLLEFRLWLSKIDFESLMFQTFKESVMELIPFAIPLPDLLPECENQFTVDYFEKKGTLLTQLYFQIGYVVIDTNPFVLKMRRSLISVKSLRSLQASPVNA